jgi:hypothetical protein
MKLPNLRQEREKSKAEEKDEKRCEWRQEPGHEGSYGIWTRAEAMALRDEGKFQR